jgi:hypothetical protein
MHQSASCATTRLYVSRPPEGRTIVTWSMTVVRRSRCERRHLLHDFAVGSVVSQVETLAGPGSAITAATFRRARSRVTLPDHYREQCEGRDPTF